ncbi:DUF371 domain-containing protein, partial [bacterium]|nr:DUF371 domain-containing protein [bacterium]
SFFIFGHSNTLCTHKNTIEFTKDSSLSKKGDCILGVNADFDFDKLMEFIKNKENCKCIIEVNGIKEEINFIVNKEFNSMKEIVIRRSQFTSVRTLGIRADKVAVDVDRRIVEYLKNPKNKASVKFI